MKKIFIIIVYIISIFILLYSCIRFVSYNINSTFFSKEYEVDINASNKDEIIKLISYRCDNPEKITKLKFKCIMGDGKLYLYEGLKKYNAGFVSVNSDITQYMLDNGSDPGYKYTINLIISLIFFIFFKSIIKNNEDDIKGKINRQIED